MSPLQAALEGNTRIELRHESTLTKAKHEHKLKLALEDPLAQPLDAVLLNNGGDVAKRAMCGNPAASLLRPLEDRFEPGWFFREYPPDLADTLGCDGHIYALPLGLHRINNMVYNRALFEAAGFTDPERQLVSLDDLLGAARDIQAVFDARGEADASVFAVPRRADSSDELSLFLVENVMLAEVGLEDYRDYWLGCSDRNDVFSRGIARVEQLSVFFNTAELDRATLLERVITGKSAMFVTGDWVAADLTSPDVSSMPFPGTQDYWVYTADVFALPHNGDAAKGLAWLHAISELEAQQDFAERKRAIPARLDVPAPERPDDPRAGARLVRTLPAMNPPLWNIGGALQAWAASSFEQTQQLLDVAALEHRAMVERRARSAAPATSCGSGAER